MNALFSSVAWVRRGAALPVPIKYELENEELDALEEEKEELLSGIGNISLKTLNSLRGLDDDDDEEDDAQDEIAEDEGPVTQLPGPVTAEDHELAARFGLDTYDDEDEAAFFNVGAEVYHKKGEKDPYITTRNTEDDEEEVDDIVIKEGDALLLVGVTDEEEFSHLNVYLYEEELSNLYIHHDIVLPAFPLCLSWMNYSPPRFNPATGLLEPTTTGNMVAVGTFNPEIEIWDLDVLDAIEPTIKLGGILNQKGKRIPTKKNPRALLVEGSHADSVMALHWNGLVRNILASGSADYTVKIWDLDRETCIETMKHHTNKVQSVVWHKDDQSMLLTGSYDHTVALVDVRTPNQVLKYNIPSDIESLQWNPHNPKSFIASTEDGSVHCFDLASPKAEPIWTLSAHHKAVSSVSFNPVVPNCLATVSVDKTLKIWDLTDNRPVLIFNYEGFNAQLFSCSWYQDSPNLLAVAGKDKLEVVDVLDWADVQRRFFHGRQRRVVPEESSSSME